MKHRDVECQSSPAHHSGSQFIAILKVACFFVFAGRAWQHLVWDAPFRALLWDQRLMEGVVTFLTGADWNSYVTNPAVDRGIQIMIRCAGWFYVVAALCVWLVRKDRKWMGWVLWGGAFLLVFLSFLECKERAFQLGVMLEHVIQIACPVLLWAWVFGKVTLGRWMLYARLAIAATFIGHGLYAVGFYPQPGGFVDMLIHVFGMSEPAARSFLQVAACMDFIVGIAIFFSQVAGPFLLYAVGWGLLTAFARIAANFYVDFFWESINQYAFEVMVRLSHGLLPLVLYSFMRSAFKKSAGTGHGYGSQQEGATC